MDKNLVATPSARRRSYNSARFLETHAILEVKVDFVGAANVYHLSQNQCILWGLDV